MNKYLKLALEQKLRDNDIEIGEKFRIQYWGVGYVYDGNELKEDCGVTVKFNDTDNVYGLLNNDFIKLPEYRKISFEVAYKRMCYNNIIYLKRPYGKMHEVWISECADIFNTAKLWGTQIIEYEFVATKPHLEGLKFSDLYKYEFYEKINY